VVIMADQTYLFRELSRNKREELGTGLLPVVELGEIEPLTRECVEIVSWTRRGLAGLLTAEYCDIGA
jgi:hypothetical protein